MKIIISPFSQKLRNGKENPKNYPVEYWKKLIGLSQEGNEIIQVGVPGEEKLVEDFRQGLKMRELKELLDSCDLFISVDSFLPHMAHHYGKPGIVLFSRSNPEIYGYRENINLYKDRKHFREDQFGLWESTPYVKEAFIEPEKIIQYITK